jgi:hypothetical protein
MTDDPEIRRELMELASQWRALAVEEERTAADVSKVA